MTKLFSLSLLACVFFIHSAKAKTNQRRPATPVSEKKISALQPDAQKSVSSLQLSSTPLSLQQTNKLSYQPLFANRVTAQPRSINLFVSKIDFTKEGVSLFLHHTFNNKEYATEFLPYSFTHLAQFIEFAHAQKQSPEFIEGTLRLFNQKYKNAPFVTAPALERFLDKTYPFLEQQLAAQNYTMWCAFKETLSQAFRKHFTLAKQDPLGFFEYVSKDLSAQVTQNVISPTRVRSTFFRFLTSSTDKLIWSPNDQERTWYSFKKLGTTFYALHTAQVIPDELDANELYWSLVERYCHFLKLSGTHLSLETCKTIKRDLLETPLSWLRHKEQEAVLETKMERLMAALLEVEAKLHAKDQGILTETLLSKTA